MQNTTTEPIALPGRRYEEPQRANSRVAGVSPARGTYAQSRTRGALGDSRASAFIRPTSPTITRNRKRTPVRSLRWYPLKPKKPATVSPICRRCCTGCRSICSARMRPANFSARFEG
jgi:hypothetical protein